MVKFVYLNNEEARYMELIVLKNASKCYGKKTVLTDINLSVIKGQTLVLTGPNGTGKSTLLRILSGLGSLSSGERIVVDKSIRIAYIPEHFPKLNFTPAEYLLYMGKIEGLYEDYIKNRSKELFEMFNTTSMKDICIKYLSKGTIQKIAVMQAVISEPDILLLDEPLSGQDLESQNTFIDMMLDYKKKGMSIVLACHETHLAKSLGDSFISITDGKTIHQSSPILISEKLMQISFTTDEDFIIESVNSSEGVQSLIKSGMKNLLLVQKEFCDSVLLMLLKNGCSIVEVKESADSEGGGVQHE